MTSERKNLLQRLHRQGEELQQLLSHKTKRLNQRETLLKHLKAKHPQTKQDKTFTDELDFILANELNEQKLNQQIKVLQSEFKKNFATYQQAKQKEKAKEAARQEQVKELVYPDINFFSHPAGTLEIQTADFQVETSYIMPLEEVEEFPVHTVKSPR